MLNGGSSSGKTGIARCLQAILPRPWISIGVDDLLDALPPSLMGSGSGVAFGRQGEVTLGDGFREIARGDRVGGMAASQAAVVHTGVVYDIEVDTSQTASLDCARAIAAWVV